MMTTRTILAGRVLPASRVVTALAVVAAAAITALAAQWRIPLPFTPVPITGQTFAVLLAGAALGSGAGATSQLLYLAVGAVGVPVFTGASGGIEVFAGPTAGYLMGFVAAAWVVGRLAERGHDRTPLRAIPLFAVGTLVIYAVGVPGLMITTGTDLGTAIATGVAPFVVGDVIKATAAGLLLPGAWKLLKAR